MKGIKTRPRKSINKELPSNLYRSGNYYRYKHPYTGKFHGLGKNKAEAILLVDKFNCCLEKINNDNHDISYCDDIIYKLTPELKKIKSEYSATNKDRPRLYSIWAGMKNRCSNKENTKYHYYGEKGVLVCDDWKKSFILFCK